MFSMKKLYTSLLLIIFIGIFNTAEAFENIVTEENIQQTVVQKEKDEVKNKTLEAEVTFDWLDISQVQRDEQILKYKSLLFDNNDKDVYYTKDEFKKEFSNYSKDKEYKHHYMLTNNGVTEDEEAKYCAFYYRKNTLVMYAIQYNKNPHNAFYYTAFGKLYYVDVTSKDYPNYPYYSMQYDRKGNLKSAIYFISHDMQYMYGPDREFQGLWYKDKMYSAKGKQTLTRTNW